MRRLRRRRPLRPDLVAAHHEREREVVPSTRSGPPLPHVSTSPLAGHLPAPARHVSLDAFSQHTEAHPHEVPSPEPSMVWAAGTLALKRWT
jgi:hypothetical protein